MAGFTYPINIPVNAASALAGANSIDTLTAALKAEEKALGSTRTALARMQAGSKVDLGLVSKAKEGVSRVDALKRQILAARMAGERPTRLGFIAAIEKSGGPIGGLIRNTRAAWEALKDNPSAAVAAGLVVTSVAAVALGERLLGLARDAITLGVGFADSARSMRLLNDAADIAGGTHKQLTGIIEDVRRKSDLGRDKLSEYARELRVLGFDSRQTQLILTSMAIAETTLGASASAGVKAIAEQSRSMRRFAVGARDAYGEYQSLRTIGLSKADLFAELGKASGRSIGEIQRSVALGQVSVKAGMAAIESALTKKFGGTAKSQALSLTSQFRRMREDFEGLFAGANVEPLLKSLSSITSIFSQDTASGRAFSAIVTSLMDELGKTVEKLTPDIKEALLGLSADAAKPGGLATTIRGWIADAKELGATIKDVAKDIKSIASSAATIGGAVTTVTGAFTSKASSEDLRKLNARGDIDAQLREQGKGAGAALTAGVAAGVDAGTDGALLSITGLAAKMQDAFKAANKIQSPSKVYAADASNIPKGVRAGVRAATPAAVEAIVDMSASMRGGFSAPGQGLLRGGSTTTNNFYATFQGMGSDADLERKVKVWIFESVKEAADLGPAPRLA